jgi:hypothetical protein
MNIMKVFVIVKAVVNQAMDGLDKVMGVFVDRKNERTYFETNISEDDRRISPVYADAPKPDWFQVQVPGLPGQLKAIMNNGKVFEPILYKNKKGEDRAKVFIRDGTVVYSGYRTIRGVYFGVQVRSGHPFLIVDERFVVEVPNYINGESPVRDFLLNQGISSDLANVAAKLKLSLLGANDRPRQYKDEKSSSGVNIDKPKKDDLPGVSVAHSEPGDELGGDETIDNANSGVNGGKVTKAKDKDGNKANGKSNGKHKPEGRVKSDQEITSAVKAGVVDPEAEIA